MYFQGRWISCGENDSFKTVRIPMCTRLIGAVFALFMLRPGKTVDMRGDPMACGVCVDAQILLEGDGSAEAHQLHSDTKQTDHDADRHHAAAEIEGFSAKP